MRYPAGEKLEIIRLVEQSHLPVRRTLERLGIPRATFYRWYDLYQTGGPEALEDRSSQPRRIWDPHPRGDPKPSVRQLCLQILRQPKMLKDRGQRLGRKLLERRVLAGPDLPLQQLRGFLMVLNLPINVDEIERTTAELLEVGTHAVMLLIERACGRGIGLLGQAHQLVIGFGVVLNHPPRESLDRSGLSLPLGQPPKLNLSHAPNRRLVDEKAVLRIRLMRGWNTRRDLRRSRQHTGRVAGLGPDRACQQNS